MDKYSHKLILVFFGLIMIYIGIMIVMGASGDDTKLQEKQIEYVERIYKEDLISTEDYEFLVDMIKETGSIEEEDFKDACTAMRIDYYMGKD